LRDVVSSHVEIHKGFEPSHQECFNQPQDERLYDPHEEHLNHHNLVRTIEDQDSNIGAIYPLTGKSRIQTTTRFDDINSRNARHDSALYDNSNSIQHERKRRKKEEYPTASIL
jgi:hypothetical protein